MPSTYIPHEHDLVRYVPWARLRKNEDDVVLGVLPAAFQLRESEEYLSVTWAQFFRRDTREEAIHAAARAIKSSSIDVRPKSGFAIGNAGSIAGECENHGCRIRIIHEAADDNEAHAAVRNWPKSNQDLLDRISSDCWSEVLLNVDLPAD